MNERDFYCEKCQVRFRITVEPDYSLSIVRSEFPESLKWLRGDKFCPVCGEKLEVE